MPGNCHIVVGGRGTGKSTYVKSKLDRVPNMETLFIYDINNEYNDYYPFLFENIQTFLQKVKNIRGGVLVFEEATTCFKTRATDDILTDIIYRSRHTGNYIFLIFHSLRAVPNYIYEASQYITVFKTNDAENRIDQKFNDERLTTILVNCKNSSNLHYYEFMEIY